MQFRLESLADPRFHMLVIAVLLGMIGLSRRPKELAEGDDPINRAVVVYVIPHTSPQSAKPSTNDQNPVKPRTVRR